MEKDDEDAIAAEPKPADDAAIKKLSGQLVVEEEVELGHLSWSSCTYPSVNFKYSDLTRPPSEVKVYLSSMRGSEPPIMFWSFFLLIIISAKLLSQLSIWVLGVWAGEYETHDPQTVPVS